MEADCEFLSAVGRLHSWVEGVPPERRLGEWECNYPRWSELYEAWEKLLSAHPVARWSEGLMNEALFAIARDNEDECLARSVATYGEEGLLSLAERSLELGEPDARWQLASTLGMNEVSAGEAVLLRMSLEEDEYVRRRAVQSLARIGSPRAEEAALREWERAPDTMPWSRMNALWVLRRVRSSRLDDLMAEAEASSNEYLRSYPERLRSEREDP